MTKLQYKTVICSRDDIKLTKTKYYARGNTTTEDYILIGRNRIEAKVISQNLAKYNYQNKTINQDSRWHVIHLPTGLVIADVVNCDITMVKNSFEAEHWYIKAGSSNTLTMVQKPQTSYQRSYSFKPLEWEMECFIKYNILELVS